jgi:hypothetical protein
MAPSSMYGRTTFWERYPWKKIEILNPIRLWCLSNGFSKLKDFSEWTTTSLWHSWKSLSPPAQLLPLLPTLLDHLSGCTPLNLQCRDTRCWGSSKYSVKQGYASLLADIPGPPPSKIWSFVWSGPSLPKINAFIWVMVHNKILTAENLQKRGIVGPSRCALCMASEESIQHLFFECPLSIHIWDLMIAPLRSLFHPPSNWNDMFVHWKQRYVGSFNKKLLFASLWRQTPNFI